MTTLALAREWALLGAETAVAAARRDDSPLDPTAGWGLHADRWAALRIRLTAPPQDTLWTHLTVDLGLPALDAWLAVIAVAAEAAPDVAVACSLLSEDERIHLPTAVAFARLAREGLGEVFASGLAAGIGGPAVSTGLLEPVEAVTGRPLSARGLRIAAADLPGLLSLAPSAGLPAGWTMEVPAAAAVFPEARGAAALLADRSLLLVRAASLRGAAQLALDLATLRGEAAIFAPAPGDDRYEGGAWSRGRSGLIVVDFTRHPAERPLPLNALEALAKRRGAVVALVHPNTATGRRAVVDARVIDWEEAGLVWTGLTDDTTAAVLGGRFRVNVIEARDAVAEARDLLRVATPVVSPTPLEPAPPDAEQIAARVLAQGGRGMGRLVTVLRTPARVGQLIVPRRLREQLDEIVAWHHGAPRARAALGAARVGALGRGLACLFSGPSGTGKTFAAQCLANELGLNLYRIDLSQVVSKYIGETEKALAQVFEEAEAGHGVLLFDEADALFGRRSEVKDAHDRYANIEVGYLLQRMESFDGIAILTTNLRGNMDPAFTRRLRFSLDFPMPDAAARLRLWTQFLPDSREEGLPLAELGERFRLSGGNIHNIGVAATHLALADHRGTVRAEHLVRATWRELEKAGMSRSPGDFGAWARHLPVRDAS